MGRPRKDHYLYDILLRIANGEGMWDLRSGDGPSKRKDGKRLYTRGQLQHYTAELRKRGYLRTNKELTDSITGKVWDLTDSGIRWLNVFAPKLQGDQHENSSTGTTGVSSPALLLPGQWTYSGAHNMNYRLRIKDFGHLDRFKWDGENEELKNWTQKIATFSNAVIRLNGKSSVSINVALEGRFPYETEYKAILGVLRLKALLEDNYGCRLEEPVKTAPAKHEFPENPIAQQYVSKGTSWQIGGAGMDNTPEPNTSHYDLEEAAWFRHLPGILKGIEGRQLDTDKRLAIFMQGVLEGQKATLEGLNAVLEALKSLHDVPPKESGAVENKKVKDTKEGYG